MIRRLEASEGICHDTCERGLLRLVQGAVRRVEFNDQRSRGSGVEPYGKYRVVGTPVGLYNQVHITNRLGAKSCFQNAPCLFLTG